MKVVCVTLGWPKGEDISWMFLQMNYYVSGIIKTDIYHSTKDRDQLNARSW